MAEIVPALAKILTFCRDVPQSQGDIVTGTGVSQPTVSKFTNKAVEHGYLQTAPSSGQSARKLYLTTDLGEKFLETGRASSQEFEKVNPNQVLLDMNNAVSKLTSLLIEQRVMLEEFKLTEQRLSFLSQAISTGLIPSAEATTAATIPPVAKTKAAKVKTEKPLTAATRFHGHRDSIWDALDPRFDSLSQEDQAEGFKAWYQYCMSNPKNAQKYCNHKPDGVHSRLELLAMSEDQTISTYSVILQMIVDGKTEEEILDRAYYWKEILT